jgi:hypothetical protein
MVSVENSNLEGAGFLLKQAVWDAARSTIEEWTGQRLAGKEWYYLFINGSMTSEKTHSLLLCVLPLTIECSLYGIRVYEEGTA